MTRRIHRTLPLLFVVLAGSCSAPRFEYAGPGGGRPRDLLEFSAQRPLPPGQPLQSHVLGTAPGSSVHLVQIGTEEPLHRHLEHDFTVVLLQGKGVLRLVEEGRDREIHLREGSIALVPRGVAHAYLNHASGPTVALAVFSPPYDGKDVVLVGE